MSKTPQATVTVGDAEITLDVCALTLNTEGKGGNTLSLSNGANIPVDDEFAQAVAIESIDKPSGSGVP